MKKINWDSYLKDNELIMLLALVLITWNTYQLDDHKVWLFIIILWLIGIYLRLRLLSRLAVGGAVKESIDE